MLQVPGACQSDVTVEALARHPANTSCAEGYDQAICSVCADRYKKTKDNSCLRTFSVAVVRVLSLSDQRRLSCERTVEVASVTYD